MPNLTSASVEQLRRLLEAFPAPKLKAEWPGTKGQKKEDACQIIAGTKDHARITKFLIENFAHCHQHVLILRRLKEGVDPLAALPTSELLGTPRAGESFYLSSVIYSVYLLDPLDVVSVEVLSPVKIEQKDNMLLIRTFVLERDPSNYSGRPMLKAVRNFDEKKMANDLAQLGLPPLDINKGVKALWDSKEIDAPRVKYKESDSTNTIEMDNGAGLRETNPKAYENVVSKPLLNTAFRPKQDPEDTEKTQKMFQVNPSFGRLGFTSYSDDPGDTDAVIKAIVANNQ